ncbi:MAG: SpoIIE family protein phosphatase [Oscillospiraceae bacterium]|nr:SpoIIE family protein phosphatase [Oscillospiraceae bacterium]
MKLRVKTKVAALFLIMGILLSTIIGYTTYRLSYNQVVDSYADLAFSSALLVADILKGIDLDSYLEHGTDEEYYDIFTRLQNLKRFFNIEFLYVVRPSLHKNESVYIFDIYTEVNDPEHIFQLGEIETEWVVNEYVLKTYLSGINEDSTVITDSIYGHLASAYVPVFAPDGSIQAVVGVDICMDVILRDVRNQTFQILSVALGINALFFVVILILIQRQVLNHIVRLSNHMKNFSADEGGLKWFNVANTGDELQDMSVSFNRMLDAIKHYMQNLEKVTSDRERIATELDVATKIQTGMLPCIFPAFPERDEFDLYASMEPAKEVGGDFYDFFLVDENTLAVVMADVSGKGVPAALFMVITKTLIKNNAQNGKTPAEVFDTVNNLLCENNEAGMFVTAFLGYLDIPTGKFVFVNAGHNPPLIKRAGEHFEWFKTKPGFILAGMEDIVYKQYEAILNKGDELFLYTDGITEAVNNENDLFSDPCLLEAANRYVGMPLKEFTVSIKNEIDIFADGVEQADDITMLMLRYRG